jgi:hypothetical protein
MNGRQTPYPAEARGWALLVAFAAIAYAAGLAAVLHGLAAFDAKFQAELAADE